MLDYSPRNQVPLVVLEVAGDLDIATQGSFETAVFDQLGRSSVIVDFAQLDFLAISALRSLVLCQRYAESRDRPLVYATCRRQARRLIALAGLDRLLTQSDTVAAAWARMTGSARPAGPALTATLPRQRIGEPAGRDRELGADALPHAHPRSSSSRWSRRTVIP